MDKELIDMEDLDKIAGCWFDPDAEEDDSQQWDDDWPRECAQHHIIIAGY